MNINPPYKSSSSLPFRNSQKLALRKKTKKRSCSQLKIVAMLFFTVLIACYLAIHAFSTFSHNVRDASEVVRPLGPHTLLRDSQSALKNADNKKIDPPPANNNAKKDAKEAMASASVLSSYDKWKDTAINLAALPPDQVISTLETHDPFGTRTFETKILEQETTLRRSLTMEELRGIFSCPVPSERISLPDQRDESKAEAYRRGDHGTFLFFQHLRKAGGTNFCSLAESNLPKTALPSYYCMPDMGWSGNKNAGYLHSWSNKEITNRMTLQGFRIAGNEWDNFDPTRHFDLPGATFATSFRKPLDRALSQFRFECIEDRGCHIKDVNQWWSRRTDLYNVYTKTFSDPPNNGIRKHFEGSLDANVQKRKELMALAMDTLSKFNIVLVMEWLAYAAPQVQDVLGFKDTTALTERVRPHINEAKRNDGQDVNKLGSAGIKKASWVPKEYLDAEQYKIMQEHLAMDEILTDIARRFFLERLVCT